MEEFLLGHGPLLAYFGIALALTLTGCGLPIPEEVFIIIAGVASSGADSTLDPWFALLACVVGAIAGDSVVYGLGRFLGHKFFHKHPIFARILHEDREAQMEEKLRRHGLKVLFVARFLVGVRAPIYLAAGVMRVPFRRFLLFDAFCATAVVSFFFVLSFFFGQTVGEIITTYRVPFTIAVVVIVLGAAAIWALRRRARKANAEPLTVASPNSSEKKKSNVAPVKKLRSIA